MDVVDDLKNAISYPYILYADSSEMRVILETTQYYIHVREGLNMVPSAPCDALCPHFPTCVSVLDTVAKRFESC
jgi:hypothetical protein